jgi:uncharacterized protein
MTAESSDRIEVFVREVVFDPEQQSPVLLLSDLGQTFTVPIFIGMAEASAIAAHLDKLDIGRPLTHDLLLTVLTELGGEVTRVEITDVREGTYIATLHLRRGERELQLDARPSDAMALAIRCKAPIFLADHVIDEGNLILADDTDQ